MNCPMCSKEIGEGALLIPSRGEAAKAIATDWRIWLATFGAMALTGLLAGLAGYSGAGAGGGAAIGFVIAARMAKLRKCPHCKALFGAGAAKPKG